jgi:hypothetical protein
MGNWKSKPETAQQAQERIARETGILIPPSFINCTSTTVLPISSQALLKASQAVTPSLLNYVWATSVGTRLLNDYMKAGISVQIPTRLTLSANDDVHHPNHSMIKNQILLNLSPNGAPQQAQNLYYSNPYMILTAQQAMGVFQFQFVVPTTNITPTNAAEIPPSLQVSAVSPSSRFGFNANIPLFDTRSGETNSDHITDAAGGWWQVQYKDRIGDGFDIMASSWMTLNHFKHALSDATASSTITTAGAATRSRITPLPQLHVQLGVDYQESLVAVQTRIPLPASSVSALQLPNIESLVSINLNHRPAATDTISTSAAMPPPLLPPLWLSLKQSHNDSYTWPTSSLWTLNLSQIVFLDQMHINPFEDRAPHIRRTLGWVVQVEQQAQQPARTPNGAIGAESPPSNPFSSILTWSAGASVQWNRHLATKFVWNNSTSNATGTPSPLLHSSIIWKTWKEPALTLSLLHSWDVGLGKSRGWGVGFELQAASSSTDDTRHDNDDEPYYNYYPESSTSVPGSCKGQGPPTKIHVPGSTASSSSRNR